MGMDFGAEWTTRFWLSDDICSEKGIGDEEDSGAMGIQGEGGLDSGEVSVVLVIVLTRSMVWLFGQVGQWQSV